MILYPTETIYALGVNAFFEKELELLYQVKGREAGKSVSVLVRDVYDIAHYAELSPKAELLARHFLPGPLTLVLKAKETVPNFLLSSAGTLGFRISSDQEAATLIKAYIKEHNSPLTCTSANLSGQPTLSTPQAIIEQLANQAVHIDKIIDDGPRVATASTVVEVVGDEVTIHRAGAIAEGEILKVLA